MRHTGSCRWTWRELLPLPTKVADQPGVAELIDSKLAGTEAEASTLSGVFDRFMSRGARGWGPRLPSSGRSPSLVVTESERVT